MYDAMIKAVGLDINAEDFKWDLPVAKLVEQAIKNGDAGLASNGSLIVKTGERTGRSPEDRFIVDAGHAHSVVHWGSSNRPINQAHFDVLHKDLLAYLSASKPYLIRGFTGARRPHARKVLVVAEKAHQALFAKQMLVRPKSNEMEKFVRPDITVLVAPGFSCDPKKHGTTSSTAVMLDFDRKIVLIAGTGYSGEIKKAVFTMMNYCLPVEDDVLTMHCSANVDPKTNSCALFFGLSGTGKTTLSADPNRQLIGDDEHAWCREGIFNLEGGCYAKAIGLTKVREPEIYGAIRFGAICENVVVNPETRKPDYEDDSITENTRVAYPVEFIPNALQTGVDGIPDVVIFLAADAFGVLPPIARLTQDAAKYHFLTGFTSKIPGTEVGINEPKPTFSSMFGEPFMPLTPEYYAWKLGEKIGRHNVRCYLINTGWTGGPYGIGHRIDLGATRAIVDALLDGSIEEEEFLHDDLFNIDIPRHCPGVSSRTLNPRGTWQYPEEYDKAAIKLAKMFVENWKTHFPDLDVLAKSGGPQLEVSY